jgi:hypothetical protein
MLYRISINGKKLYRIGNMERLWNKWKVKQGFLYIEKVW